MRIMEVIALIFACIALGVSCYAYGLNTALVKNHDAYLAGYNACIEDLNKKKRRVYGTND